MSLILQIALYPLRFMVYILYFATTFPRYIINFCIFKVNRYLYQTISLRWKGMYKAYLAEGLL